MGKFLAAFIVGALMCTPVAAVEQCAVEGPPDLREASQTFCQYGIFTKIKTTVDDEARLFNAELSLNARGFDVFNSPRGRAALFNEFGTITANFWTRSQIKATITFKHGGLAIARCTVNTAKEQVTCKPVVDEKIAGR